MTSISAAASDQNAELVSVMVRSASTRHHKA